MIRVATIDDRFEILRLAKQFLIASGVAVPWDAAYAERTAKAYIADADKLCLVHCVRGTVRGVLAAHEAIHPFSPVRYAMELLWWVEPDHRGMEVLRMVDRYEDWARERICAFTGLAVLDDERVARFYRRRGYAPTEAHFLKPLI